MFGRESLIPKCVDLFIKLTLSKSLLPRQQNKICIQVSLENHVEFLPRSHSFSDPESKIKCYKTARPSGMFYARANTAKNQQTTLLTSIKGREASASH